MLSPQSMIDQGERDNAMPILLDPNRGLQEIQDYPLRRTRSKFAVAEYKPDKPRYNKEHGYVKRGFDAEGFERIVAEMFCEGGKRFPMVVAIYMGDLQNRKFAKQRYDDKAPFHYSQQAISYIKETPEAGKTVPLHAMLVVGIDNTSTDPSKRYIIVKNQWGKVWGENGYSKIGFDEIFELHVVTELPDGVF